MSLTLGLTGMDPATETALRAAFVDANARLGGHWSLLPDAEADHVVVDMDSMYGPMSWLRLHAAGRKVIGLTSAPRTQTDYRLGRPFDTGQMVELLVAIAQGAGIRLQPAADAGQRAEASGAPAIREGVGQGDARAAQASQEDSAVAIVTAPASGMDASAAADAEVQATEASPASDRAGDEAVATVPASMAGSADVPSDAADEAQAPDEASDALAAHEASPEPATERTLAAWLQPGVLRGRHRLVSGRGPALLIDADAELWHGPATLKPLLPCFEGIVDESDLEPVDADAWAREAAAAGAAQPLTRLRWLGGLLAGGGALVPGVDPDGRFQLTRWPQTEREFPRHFRIATQMMKGPATVPEIAEASGMPVADVADFVNANLATGFAEPVVEAPPPAEPAKPRGGLLGRLRR